MIPVNFPKGVKYIPVLKPNNSRFRIRKNKKWFKLVEDHLMEWYDEEGLYHSELIPKGYEWDGATIPQMLWSFLGYGKMGALSEISVTHDWPYILKGKLHNGTIMSRKQSDTLFKNQCLAIGIPERTASIMYRAIRIGGLKYWRDV